MSRARHDTALGFSEMTGTGARLVRFVVLRRARSWSSPGRCSPCSSARSAPCTTPPASPCSRAG